VWRNILLSEVQSNTTRLISDNRALGMIISRGTLFESFRPEGRPEEA